MRPDRLLLAIPVTLAAAAPASAAEISLRVAPGTGVRLGQPLAVSGGVTEGAAAVAGRAVRLEVRRHPYRGRWKPRGTRTTNAAGRFSFAPELDRNHRVRVRLVGDGAYLPGRNTLSRVRRAYVLPAFTLTFRQLEGRRIRLTQVYTVPRDVRLRARTRFYVGPAGARRAPFVAAARTRRLRAGRYRARAVVRLPAAYEGRFSYVSCFGYSRRSGMGDPDLRCPRRSVRLD